MCTFLFLVAAAVCRQLTFHIFPTPCSESSSFGRKCTPEAETQEFTSRLLLNVYIHIYIYGLSLTIYFCFGEL